MLLLTLLTYSGSVLVGVPKTDPIALASRGSPALVPVLWAYEETSAGSRMKEKIGSYLELLCVIWVKVTLEIR